MIKNTGTHIHIIPGNLSLSEMKDCVNESCSHTCFNNFLRKTLIYLRSKVKDLVNQKEMEKYY